MKKLLLFASLFTLFIGTHAQTNHIVISQIYGAGGNSGALFKNDFVELFNPTANAIDITGWSLQYASAVSSNWSTNKVGLTGIIAPGKYFLVQLNGGVNGSDLPAPDLVSTNITMSASAGKLALVNTSVSLAENCPLPASFVDMIGYGSTADCSETANAPATTASLAIIRINNGCTDDDHNFSDFVQAAPSPRNSSSSANLCNGSGISITSISGLPFCVDGTSGANVVVQFNAIGSFTNANFTAYLSAANGSFASATPVGSQIVSGTNPSGSINISIPSNIASGLNYRIRINADNPSLTGNQSAALEVINGAKNISSFSSFPASDQTTLSWTSPSGCFDEMLIVAKEGNSVSGMPTGDGSLYTSDLNFTGNGTSFGGGKVVYKGAVSGQTVTGLLIGTRYYFKIFTRKGTNWSTGIEINDLARHLPQPGEIVINQLSPEYANASNEYVEIVNTTNKDFDLADLLLGYQSSVGGGSINEGLTGILKAHSYWLLSSEGVVTVGKTSLLNSDDQINGNFAQGGGQIALIRKADGAIIDAVAYGNASSGNYIEGSPAAAAPVDGGLKRATDGVDNNTNNVDFVAVNNADVDLRNSSSILANEGAEIPSGTYARIYVTGNASLSGPVTLSEKVVLVNGILELGAYNLTSNEAEGGSANCYIKTNGAGTLVITDILADPKTFPVGNNTWNPIVISNGGGLSWNARVEDAVQGVSSNKLVVRTWHISPSATPTTGANLTFGYNDGDVSQLSGNFNKNEDVQVWNFHDGKWQGAGLIATPTGSAGGDRTVTLTSWTQFSPFALANMTGPLPITFNKEKAVFKNSSVEVSWSNLTEENVKHYEVERSADGVNFYRAGIIDAGKNDGATATYTFIDAPEVNGKLFYRIKAVEDDGSITYSRIVAVDIDRRIPSLSIYPNPVKGSVVYYNMQNMPKGNYVLSVYNASGQSVHTGYVSYSGLAGTNSFSFAGSKPGLYFFVLTGPVTVQKKFIVE